MAFLHDIRAWLLGRFGGPARAKVIIVLALVFALDNADLSAVGAMASILQTRFGIGRTDVGLLITASSGAAALATLLFGWLVDRVERVRLLWMMLLVWAAIMVVTGLATSYEFLLVTRIGLGVAIAVTTPAVASLIGDYFPARERASVFGLILTGDMIGTAFGFIISGELATVWWRLGFWALAVAAPLLAWAIHRLPEPARGGSSWIEAGQEQVAGRHGAAGPNTSAEDRQSSGRLRGLVLESDVQPREQLVLDEDPGERSLWWAIGYVLRIPTNVILIIGSALGYYFFAGARTFGVEYFQARFGLGHGGAILVLGAVGAGALGGVYLGGWLADRLLAEGRLESRVRVATGAYLASAVLLLAGLLVGGRWGPWALFFLGSLALGAANPPLDSARLDIMHPRLWGRAESIRVLFRKIGEGVAPLLFGYLASRSFGGGAHGLTDAFVVMVGPLFVSGLLGFLALRTYPRDVATAEAYTERTLDGREPGAPRGAGDAEPGG